MARKASAAPGMGSMPSAKWLESKKAWTISLEASREQPQTLKLFQLSFFFLFP